MAPSELFAAQCSHGERSGWHWLCQLLARPGRKISPGQPVINMKTARTLGPDVPDQSATPVGRLFFLTLFGGGQSTAVESSPGNAEC